MWELEVVEIYKIVLFSRLREAISHMNSQQLWQHAQDLWSLNQDDQMQAWRECSHEISYLTEELLPTDSFWETKNVFALRVWSWEMSLFQWKANQSRVNEQHNRALWTLKKIRNSWVGREIEVDLRGVGVMDSMIRIYCTMFSKK